MTNILGISAHYHDSAACLVQDGVVVAAAQEEAFTRLKHDRRFPTAAIRYCLAEGDLDVSEIDWFGYYELPELKRQRVLASARACSSEEERGFAELKARHDELDHKYLAGIIPRGGRHTRLHVIEHHLSHAAAAFYPSPFNEAAVITIDGVGEYTTTAIAKGEGNKLRLLRKVAFPHSLGLLYSAFTYYCGFRVNSGEYKLMGLAPYGSPRFAGLIESELVRIAEDGSFRLNMEYFSFLNPRAQLLTSSRFEDLFGQPARRAEDPLTEFHADIAASIQQVFESAVIKVAKFARSITDARLLCMAGGGALNCVANRRLREAEIFDDIWVQPAATDAGSSLGVALHVWHGRLGHERTATPDDAMHGALLGPAYSDDRIRIYLESVGARYSTLSESDLLSRTAAGLAAGKVVGWFQGRLEFGPRALGNRSILADPRRVNMRNRLNLKTKRRESFRPFAPAVALEAADTYFDGLVESPYMLFTASLSAPTVQHSETGAQRLLEGTEPSRYDLPAITHVDKSARVQTVDKRRNRLFWSLLTKFGEITDCPVLVNTSFNLRGEPMVCSPEDALRCFMRTDIDILVLGRQVLTRADVRDASVDVTGPLPQPD